MPTVAKPTNLNRQSQDRRLREGLLMFGLGLCAAVILMNTGLPLALRLVLFVPFFFAAAQAQAGLLGTCAMAALRGQRITEQGPERMANPQERQCARDVARRVWATSFAVAAAATAAIMMVR